MSENDQPAEETAWAAERRGFVADRRDVIADGRDALADQRDLEADRREHEADAREAALDTFEQRLDGRASQLNRPPMRTPGDQRRSAERRAVGAATRGEARSQREQRAHEATLAAAARESAAARRQAGSTTLLASAFAELAQYLYGSADFEEVLDRIVEAAVATVEGCDVASVTLCDGNAPVTAAATDEIARRSDHAQYDAGEGPCLDALDEPVVYAERFPDPRWPVLDARPRALGAESVVSFQLSSWAGAAYTPLAGSLNAYARGPDAFDDDAQRIGLVLAAHAGVAADTVRERQNGASLSEQLHQALKSRDVIGQAKGILMERLRLTPEDAFDVLRRASQQLNVKLRDVAAEVATTGELPRPTVNGDGDGG